MTCPIPLEHSHRDCNGKQHPDGKFGICIQHWNEIRPPLVMRRERCTECGWLKSTVSPEPDPINCSNPDCSQGPATTPAPDLSPPAPSPAQRHAVVYYLRFGDRIKIGTSTNLSNRLKGIYHDELVAVEPGNVSLEQQRHREFAGSLVKGQREWFVVTTELALHMATLRAKYGNPRQVAR